MTLDYQLFLGFQLDPVYKAQLEMVPSNIRSTFIQEHPDYLQQLIYEDSYYLGKFLGSLIEFQKLELIEANIFSLLRRLVEGYPYEKNSLILLAIPKPLA